MHICTHCQTTIDQSGTYLAFHSPSKNRDFFFHFGCLDKLTDILIVENFTYKIKEYSNPMILPVLHQDIVRSGES